MSNSEKLSLLEEELKPYKEVLGKASDAITNEGVSNYPIFVVHQHQVDIGIPIIEKEKINGQWSINASSLEEFVTKNIVRIERIETFKDVFKPPSQHLCLFVLSEIGATFIFMQRTL